MKSDPEVPFEQALPVNGVHESILSPEEKQRALRQGLDTAAKMEAPRSNVTLAAVGRTLPHSLEAEECLLSACLLDGSDMMSRCDEARISPGSFYDTKHSLVYERLLDLYNRKVPIDVSVLAEELKTARLLDQVGGYAFLTQVSSRLPTTAEASYFIDKVRELAALREIIHANTRAVEDCYNFTGGFEDFTAQLKNRLTHVLDTGSACSAIAEMSGRRAGTGRKLKADTPILYLSDKVVGSRSNLVMMTALQKTGKSAVGGAIIGAVIAGSAPRGDTLHFRAINNLGQAVLHLDTEQAATDHEQVITIAKQRAGAVKTPPWLHSYGVKGIAVERLRSLLRRLLRELAKTHAGVMMVILDGVADFVTDTNDPKECNPFVTELEALATDYDCLILNVLHLNPAQRGEVSKSRGHLGSQLERKCETDIRLVKDQDGITTIYTACARHAPIFEKDGPRFSWDPQTGMHLLSGTAADPRNDVRREKALALAEAVFQHAGKQSLRFGDMIREIGAVAGIGSSASEDRFSQMKKFNVVKKDLVGFWTLTG